MMNKDIMVRRLFWGFKTQKRSIKKCENKHR